MTKRIQLKHLKPFDIPLDLHTCVHSSGVQNKKIKNSKEEEKMGIKKRLSGAVLAAGIGVAAISGGTFALFTSSATNSANSFAAGDLELIDVTGGGATATKAITVTNMAPGDSGTGTVSVKNDGSLDAWVKINQTASAASQTGSLFGNGGLSVTYDSDVVLVGAGETVDFTVSYNLPSTAGNEFQNGTGQFDVVVQAVQAKNNTTGAGPTAWE